MYVAYVLYAVHVCCLCKLKAIVSSSAEEAQAYLNAVIAAAAPFGLRPNWSKTVHMRIGHQMDILDSAGGIIKVVEETVYLGALISTRDCSANLSRRLGEAGQTFRSLLKIWSHANLARAKKFEIYTVCVLAKLLYSIEAMGLRKADYRRLDGFHCRCVRKIMGIPHSMISRVANVDVLLQAGQTPLTFEVLRRQLLMFGRAVCDPVCTSMRNLAFRPACAEPKAVVQRKRGRPRTSWLRSVHARALEVCNGSQEDLNSALQSINGNLRTWKTAVEAYIRRRRLNWHSEHV